MNEEPYEPPEPKKHGGMLVSTDPSGQPVTTETENPWEIYEHVAKGGKAFVTFEGFEHGYDIYDAKSGKWVEAMASAFTMNRDHVKDLRIEPDGTMYFDGFFNERMVSPGMVVGVEREITPKEAEDRNRRSLFGDVSPGRIVRVHMRIRPAVIEVAHLTVGKALGTKPRIDWPVRPRVRRKLRGRRGPGRGWHRQPKRHSRAARRGWARRRRRS